MVLNHLCKLLIRFKPLPLQAVFPSIKEGTGAALREIIPELAERLFQQVSGIQTSIGAEQFFERPTAIQTQVLAPRQQRVALTFDVGPILTTESFVFGSADLIQRL